MYSRVNQSPQSISNYQDISVLWSSIAHAPPLVWETDEQGTGSREGNPSQHRVPTPMKINFVVSHMTELLLTDVFVQKPRGMNWG